MAHKKRILRNFFLRVSLYSYYSIWSMGSNCYSKGPLQRLMD